MIDALNILINTLISYLKINIFNSQIRIFVFWQQAHGPIVCISVSLVIQQKKLHFVCMLFMFPRFKWKVVKFYSLFFQSEWNCTTFYIILFICFPATASVGGEDSYCDLDDVGPVQGMKRSTLKGTKKGSKRGGSCKQQWKEASSQNFQRKHFYVISSWCYSAFYDKTKPLCYICGYPVSMMHWPNVG